MEAIQRLHKCLQGCFPILWHVYFSGALHMLSDHVHILVGGSCTDGQRQCCTSSWGLFWALNLQLLLRLL
uniref:MRP1 n=1 Tax=Arundo donax TaxID=35708 RepID=A0A0A9CS02_ARUDO